MLITGLLTLGVTVASVAGEVITIQAENDILSGTDRNYTNGLRLAWARESTADEPSLAHRLLNLVTLVPGAGSSADRRWTTYSLGQSIFTPEDISLTTPDPADRPYAGWLYLGFGHVMEYERSVHVLELQVGMVGPSSLAGDTQRRWHDWFGFDEPRGWGHQLGDEPAFTVYYQHIWKASRLIEALGLQADITPHVGGAAGTLLTQLSGGATVRIGTDLDHDFGAPPRIQPSLPGSDYFDRSDTPHIYGFAGVEQRAIARNLFLDGNTFRSSPSVPSKTFVTEGHFGAALLWGPIRFALTHTIRSNEFRGQKGGNAFSSFTLSVAY